MEANVVFIELKDENNEFSNVLLKLLAVAVPCEIGEIIHLAEIKPKYLVQIKCYLHSDKFYK